MDNNKNVKRNSAIRLVLGTLIWGVGLFFVEGRYETICYALAYVIFGYDVLYDAVVAVTKLNIIDRNLLMVISSLIVALFGDLNEAAILMMVFQWSEFILSLLQDYTMDKIRQHQIDLPKNATWVLGDREMSTDVTNLSAGMVIRVDSGEIVPVDGVLRDDLGTVSLEAINGSDEVEDLTRGDVVLGGMKNIGDSFTLMVEKSFEDTLANKMNKLTETFDLSDSDYIAKTERNQKIYSICCVALALISIVFRNQISMSLEESIRFASLLFAISYPGSLVISETLTYFIGAIQLEEQGMIIKKASQFEKIKNLNVLIFNGIKKFTTGELEIAEIRTLMVQEEFLKIVASIVVYSNHPLALTILETYGVDKERRIISNFVQEDDGISAVVGDEQYYIGNYEYISSLNIGEFKKLDEYALYVATDKELIGTIIFNDVANEETNLVVKAMKAIGVDNVLAITSKTQGSVNRLKEKLFLNNIYGDLSESDKIAIVEGAKVEGSTVGVICENKTNDNLLAVADIGIEMGIYDAKESIDGENITLVNSDLRSIIKAKQIVGNVALIRKENVILTVIGKLTLVLFALENEIAVWIALIIEFCVNAATTWNCARLLKK